MNVPALAIYTPGGEPLARLELARRLLAETRSVDEVRSIHDLAEAARLFARQARLGLDAQNDAAEIKLRAERRLGELLGLLPRCRTPCTWSSSFARRKMTRPSAPGFVA